MNNDEIIRMAREAGIGEFESDEDLLYVNIYDLKAFASLIANHEREAMIVEAEKKGWAMRGEDPFEDAVREIAESRARGEK